MIEVLTPKGPIKLSFGGYLRQGFDDLKDFAKHKWDNVILVVGDEGDGKTSFVKLASLYLDPKITEKQWAYNAEQFEAIVDSDLPPLSCIVWDESDELSEAWNSKIVRTLKRKFKRIRSKQYIIWLVTPTFFDMNKYWAIKRTRCLYDVYATPERDEKGVFQPNRGQVRFFGSDSKRKLYIFGSKEWDMKATTADWWDRFGKVPENYPIPEDILEKRKDEAMKALIKAEKVHPSAKKQDRQVYLNNIRRWLTSNPYSKPNNHSFAFWFGVDEKTIRRDWAEIDRFVAENGERGSFLDGTSGTFPTLLDEEVQE